VKALVIGATGFTGRRVAAGLVNAGHDVRCLVRPASDRSALEGTPVEFVVGDLDDTSSLIRGLEGRDALMYVASMGFGHVPGTIRAMEEAGVGRGVFFSTTAIFTTLPARSRAPRLAAEDEIRNSRLDWTILRPTMIYGGPGDRNVERIFAAVERWPILPAVGGAGRKIQPVLVDDLARAAVRSLHERRAIGRCYELAGREPVRFAEFVRAAAAAVSRRVMLVPVPAAVAVAAAEVMECLMSPPIVRAEQVRRLLEDKDFDISAAVRDLDYRPAGIEEGLARAASRRRGEA